MAVLSDHEFEGVVEFLRVRYGPRGVTFEQYEFLRELRALGMLRWPQEWERDGSELGEAERRELLAKR